MIGVLVALAGGLGAAVRFVTDSAVAARLRPRIPVGTLVINVTGSLLLGLVAGWWSTHTGDPTLKAALATGFCGGYTTFSTASVEAARLLLAGRRWTAVLHAASMLVLAVAAAAVGLSLGALA